MLELFGSMVMRWTARFGKFGEPRSFRVQSGLVPVPLMVIYTSPLLWPTQMMSELPGATAIALIKEVVLVPALMLVHVGVGSFTLTLRHRLLPPASIVLGLLGSRMNGAMKLALVGAAGSSSSNPSGTPAS